MSIRVVLFAIIAGAIATASSAQPDKDQREVKSPKSAAQPVVLASASDVRRPATAVADGSSQPVRRPAPRVTTCRCGDPQPGQDQQPDE